MLPQPLDAGKQFLLPFAAEGSMIRENTGSRCPAVPISDPKSGLLRVVPAVEALSKRVWMDYVW
jgi:hypothetical protein